MKVTYNNNEISVPDFLIIGAMRSGTTSLYSYLSSHPDIFMPTLKEPQFFSYLGEPVSPHPPEIRKEPWTLKDYVQLFNPARQDQIIGEASTSYLYIYPKTQKNIRMIYGPRTEELKIIGILRNPIERAWSIYSLKRQGGDWKDDFLSYAEQFEIEGNKFQYYNFVASGLYYQQVKAYQDMFPLTKFILFDEFINNPERTVRQCMEFLGVKEAKISRKVGKVYNYSGIPKNKIAEPIYRFLFSRYSAKSLLKPFIPEDIRVEVKRWLGSRISRKDFMSIEIKGYLLRKFEKDLLQLVNLFQEEQQKKIIKGWMV
ncbi:sulfotransferase [Deltaproteobacteria bacterium]|nr:sulfotransferase [Deltaproteobacteria bacterium]